MKKSILCIFVSFSVHLALFATAAPYFYARSEQLGPPAKTIGTSILVSVPKRQSRRLMHTHPGIKTHVAHAVPASLAPTKADNYAPIEEARLAQPGSPLFPKSSRLNGEEGIVRFRLSISKNGEVVEAEILRSSGYSRLDQSAMSWVRAAEFIPARQNGKPISSTKGLDVAFRLD